MGLAQFVSIEWTQMECGECGVFFQVTDTFQKERIDTGKSWYCPNGHSRVYQESTVKKLERQLAAEQAIRRFAENNVEQLRKQMARRKKRTAAGVCPCCNLTFSNMARRIKTKHPEFPKK